MSATGRWDRADQEHLIEIEEAIVESSSSFAGAPCFPLMTPRLPVRNYPKLSRSPLHRCVARHGIAQLPSSEETAAKPDGLPNDDRLCPHRCLRAALRR